MQRLSLKPSLPAPPSLTLQNPSLWLTSSLESSLVHVLPDDVAQLTRQELDFIFCNGPGSPPPTALLIALNCKCRIARCILIPPTPSYDVQTSVY
jgi:hypothetical protein